ncbi:amidohydrolase [Cupriavidus sp. AU9028]|uniref:amidohydrolase n=1 Tax=Cupriavidus sp. AU9028 TaxID=2871157 RepID=UPI001C975FCB|nr:amidohydrolase [Cupriavidus sp. AU9028]
MKRPAIAAGLNMTIIAALLAASSSALAVAEGAPGASGLDGRVAAVKQRVVDWRRDIHQHPELSGQEARTAAMVAAHLKSLGMEVTTGVGGHGVVALLKGGQPGKVVALRADMDALPIAEATGLPFASRAVARHMGKDTPVMHGCGHDAHTAILMGVAEVLAGMKDQIQGTVKFIFQPAEEGFSEAPVKPGQLWGARAMIAEGVMDKPKVDAIFGLHISSMIPTGVIGWRSGPTMAGSDSLRIQVNGRQTHGAMPWAGVDPIVTSAQMITALQTVVSRQLNISTQPAVLSIGAINGGNRENIVPESVEMLGTLRTYDETMRADAKKRIQLIAQSTAAANGAKAEVSFGPSEYSVTVNDAKLTARTVPLLRSAAQTVEIPLVTGSEDFSEFQKIAPGFFFMLGGKPKDREVGPNHSPRFDFDEAALGIGVKSLTLAALGYLNGQ